METVKVAGGIWGDKPYQRKGREALPLLVRQARAQQPITYSSLAAELGISSPRNLGYPLGSIGESLGELSKEWGEVIPVIQCVVVDKKTGLPGEGIGEFIADARPFGSLPRREQRRLIDLELRKVYAFEGWPAVLEALGLRMPTEDFRSLTSAASEYRAGGESDTHKRLKKYVAAHPGVVGVGGQGVGEVEYQLPSGDSLDVLFRERRDWTAVEVKSRLSGVDDIARGLFQCVKYQAVVEAVQATERVPRSARAVLVLEAQFPEALVSLRNLLGVEVIDCVTPD